MGSSNGTFMGGNRISRVRLGPLQIVIFGDNGRTGSSAFSKGKHPLPIRPI
ncbi:MAG: hypothetical protein JRH20_30900 [Deltaproteobacteria bacterium]|nr:hypothetical protein [Deltaproteobacteria bacterium]